MPSSSSTGLSGQCVAWAVSWMVRTVISATGVVLAHPHQMVFRYQLSSDSVKRRS